MALALYRRYRPDTFDKVIGQDQVTVPLSRALDRGRLTHAYLFSGPRGCGKTSSARILARCINCAKGPTSHPCGECESCKDLANGGPGSIDVVEIDAASHNGVEDARELRERATFAPARDRYKIFILDEAHMVTQQGFNALLKIVEEPPEHVMFIFATTEPDKVIGTIRSRTHHYPFRLVPQETMGPYLEEICEKEQISCEPGVLKLAMRAGGGSVRDTLSILDQLMVGSVDGVVSHDVAVSLLGFTPDTLISEAIDAVVERDGERLYGVIQKVVVGGFDPRRFVEDLLARVRDLLVLTIGGERAESVLSDDAAAEDLHQLHTQAAALGLQQLSAIAETINAALVGMNGAVSPRMRLELLAARLLAGRDPESDITAGRAVGPSRQSAPVREDTAGTTGNHGETPRPRVPRQTAPAPQAGHAGFAGATHDQHPQRSGSQLPIQGQSQTAEPQTAEPGNAATSQVVHDAGQPDSRSVEERWDAVLGALPQDVRAYVAHDKVSAVALAQNAAGRQRLSMTFDRALSQHAFALALSSDAAANGRKASAVVLRAVREVFGEDTMIAPTKIAASGEHVEPTSRMAPEQLAQIKRQIALDKAGLAAASLPPIGAKDGSAQERGRSGQGERTASGDRRRDGSEKTHHDDPDDPAHPDRLSRRDDSAHPEDSDHFSAPSRPAGDGQITSGDHAAADEPGPSAQEPASNPHDVTADQDRAVSDRLVDAQDDPWLKPVTNTPVREGATRNSPEADKPASTGTSTKPHKVVAVPDMSNDDDPWAIATGPLPTEPLGVRDEASETARPSKSGSSPEVGYSPGASQSSQSSQETSQLPAGTAQSRQALGKQGDRRQETGPQPKLGRRPGAGRLPGASPQHGVGADSRQTADDTQTRGAASARVAAEDDEYSLEDRSLESATTMDMAELEKLFAVKKVEEFNADDPHNPKNAQPANKHQEG